MDFDDDILFWFVIKIIGYIVLRWMIKVFVSYKKEVFVMEVFMY